MKVLHISPQIPVVMDPNCPPGVAFLMDLTPTRLIEPVACQRCGYDVDDDGFCSCCGHTNH